MSRLKPTAWFMVGLLAASWIVFQPGVLGYDERRTFLYVTNMIQAGYHWPIFITLKGPGEGLSDMNHDFAWFVLQTLLYWPYLLLSKLVGALNSDFVTEAYMAAWMNLPMWACCFVAWKVLRQRGLTPALAGLTLAGIFAGGYVISAFPTSYLTNIEALLICAQLLFLGWDDQSASRGAFLAGLCGGYMLALRPYALPAVIALILLGVRGRKMDRGPYTIAWACGVALALAIGFLPKLFWPIPVRDYASEITPFLTSPLFIPAYLSRAGQALFSFGYGILLTAPFCLFAFFAVDRTALYIKLIAILTILGATLVFPYWPGEYGIAGDRYVLGYLFLLLPEIGEGFQYAVSRHRRVIFIVPILALMFLPCFEFRPNVTTLHAAGNYLGGPQSFPVEGRVIAGDPAKVNPRMPVWNPLFHPAVFGWWQTTALLAGHAMILPLGASVAIDPALVPLYGLAPRIAYLQLLTPGQIGDPRIAAARGTVLKLPGLLRWAVPSLAMLVMLAWGWLLVWATRLAWREAATTANRQPS